jgi:hypothetical protein
MPLIQLKSYVPEASVQISAGVQVLGTEERLFVFSWKDPQRKLMWKNSCIEAFWGELSSTGYWEMNFNRSGHWNIYRFNRERQPQPPQADSQFVVADGKWEENQAEVLVRGPWPRAGCEGAFCAITLTNGGPLYWALGHSGAKPDFHRRVDWSLRF